MRPVGGMSTAFPDLDMPTAVERVWDMGAYAGAVRDFESICERAYTRHNFVSRRNQTGRNEMGPDERALRWHGSRRFRENEPETLARIVTSCRGLSDTSRSDERFSGSCPRIRCQEIFEVQFTEILISFNIKSTERSYSIPIFKLI